ncbi:hypothetical protein [Prevotella sp. HCN-7019]|uniref:hypothetical protein n=1 Tax=Prevotella sp. HCN-7019 TaxID=3134668 RepID=UPI0030C656CB
MKLKNATRILAAALFAVAALMAVPARAAEEYRAEVSKDSLMQKAVTWLVSDGWFVESIDSSFGFVKAKKFENSDKLLSVTTATRTEVSVIIRPAGDAASTFVVQAYVTTQALKQILAKEGLTDDNELCRKIADGIKAQK